MTKTVKVKTNTWETIDGVLCAVFKGSDSIRREVAVAVPAASLKVFWSDAIRRLAAEKTRSGKSSMPPQWHHVNFLSAQQMIVGTTDNQRVGLVLDPDTATEFALSFAPKDARELAHQLVAEADNLPEFSIPKMN